MKEKEKIEILKRIDLYIRGKLTQDEIDELWKTFLEYPETYNWFETEVHLQSLIKKGKKPQFGSQSVSSSKKTTIHSYKGWLYAAAAAVLLAIGLQFFAIDQPESIPGLAVAEIEQSHLIGADVLRSNTGRAENIDVAINDALAKAYDGETEQAIQQFREILEQSPSAQQRARVEMNLGILLYNQARFESAKNHFESITEITGLEDYEKEKAWWFLGNAYLNLNQPREAREAVYQAYGFNGRFQSSALALLKKLDLQLGNVPPEQEPESLGG
ncbi:MAG: tetratricopeptide repeat protein [Balneolaceae bacterium]|nr:tetratricopeptide repeat protein [Balneolaceae bacterium]